LVENLKTEYFRGHAVLILTRKIGESIIISDNIRVVVLEVRGRQIRLGIEAPAHIVVLRDEIAQRLTDENLRAANSDYQDLHQALRTSGLKVANEFAWRSPQPGASTITFESKALGQVTVPENHVITFPSGLAGFPAEHRYALLNDHLDAPFYYLQCVDNPSVAFLVVDPASLVPDYRPKNGATALKELEAQSPEDLQVLVTLTLPPGRPQEMTANLMSPLLINPKLGLGKQVVIDKPHYSHQYPVFSLRPGCQPQPLVNGNLVHNRI
jgi:flagellar assembly factor FliW